MDEATSALVTTTEQAIAKALETHDRPWTIITIAHRLSTVRHADQIIVLDKGRVVERGNHRELITVDGIYAELVRNAGEPAPTPRA
ncbi:hypothetical protein ACIK7D_23880 [Agrobacterium sp. P15N1-A]